VLRVLLQILAAEIVAADVRVADVGSARFDSAPVLAPRIAAPLEVVVVYAAGVRKGTVGTGLRRQRAQRAVQRAHAAQPVPDAAVGGLRRTGRHQDRQG